MITALAALLGDAAESTGLRVTVASNVLPSPLHVYDAQSRERGLLALLGIKLRIEAKAANGDTLASYGDPVEFNPALAIAYGAVLVLGVIAVGATVSRFLR